jgi:hypothetical protein
MAMSAERTRPARSRAPGESEIMPLRSSPARRLQ